MDTATQGTIRHLRDAARQARRDISAGKWQSLTTGIAPGIVQGNLVMLPRDWAAEFQQFCRLNPKPCPLIAMTAPGDPHVPELGDDIDLSTDAPMYRVFRDGALVDEVPDIRALWDDDLVGFVLGCSYSFEDALIQGGLPMRHIENGTKVPIYRTTIETVPTERLRGPMMVSMRPFQPADAIRAIQITSRFPNVHGAPIHFGDPARIGIEDISVAEYNSPVELRDGEVPVFWACGVTPQSVIEVAKPPFCITHKAGHMLITDRLNAELAVL